MCARFVDVGAPRVALLAILVGAALPAAATPDKVRVWGGPPGCVDLVSAWLGDRAVLAPQEDAPGSGPERQAWLKSRTALGVYLAAGRDSVRVFVFKDGGWRGLRVWSLGGAKGCRIGARELAASRRWLEARLFAPDPQLPAPRAEPKVPDTRTATQAAAGPAGAPRPRSPPAVEGGPGTDAAARTTASTRPRTTADDDPFRRSAPPAAAPPSRGPAPPPEPPAETRAELLVGVGWSTYRFEYDAPTTANARELRFDLVAMPGLDFEIHPLDGDLQPLTFHGRLRAALGLSASRTEGGPSLPMQHLESALAVGYRIPLERWWTGASIEPVVGGRFWLAQLGGDSAGITDPDAPSFGLLSLVVGAELRFPVRGRVGARLRAAYAHGLLTTGRLNEPGFFPGVSAIGLDARGGIDVLIDPHFSAFFGVSYTANRFGLAGLGDGSRAASNADASAWAPEAGLVARLF